MEKFIFKSKETSYSWNWLDKNTFVLDFGDGEFIDSDGDIFFIHCEYHLDNQEFIFEIYWEDFVMEADKNYISDSDKENVKKFIKQLMTENNYIR